MPAGRATWAVQGVIGAEWLSQGPFPALDLRWMIMPGNNGPLWAVYPEGPNQVRSIC